MSPLAEQLQEMEAHQSIFEAALRQLPLPVCAVFGSAADPQAVRFTDNGRQLSTRDSASVTASFPHSVHASNNVVLATAGRHTSPAQGKRVAVLFSGGPAAGACESMPTCHSKGD